ncbi:27534_t:CDS:2 [Racocetra persica]|uniref:27534_t:CDS:1 n=1 Tax=Racocetra persica TaxID=160502 RepID=A0ACA9LYB0_9GLOM|nr:27534_t:CDS:2 [Racocetra persica]
MIYLKKEDKNNINEAYIEKRRKVVEENKTPKVQNIVKINPLQDPRFHKPTISKNVQKYLIVENLQQTKANISIAQLAAENPKYLRELSKSLRKKKIKPAPESMVTAQYTDDRKFRTIALYCQANINRVITNIILDSSSAKSIISNYFLKRIGLKITKPSTTLMLNINSEKRKSLGEL